MLQEIETIEGVIPWILPSFAFIFGAIVGSFLNVCIYRIPSGRSIIAPGSTCTCGQPICWYDNIPIFSWFILRGRARCCGSRYSFRYPFIELVAGLLFLVCWLTHPPIEAAVLMVFVSMLLCATFIDFDHMEIPDRFSIGLAFVGLLLSASYPPLHDIREPVFALAAIQAFFESLVGLLIGSGFILWLALVAEVVLKKEAMGFGDVKLLGGIGAFLGWQGAIFALFGGAVIGTIGLAIWFVVKNLLPSLRGSQEATGLVGVHIPFGPMLAAGALVYALVFQREADLYFELVLDVSRH